MVTIDYKRNAFKQLRMANALKTEGEHKLKSGRLSPYFFNMGDLNTGMTTSFIAKAFAGVLREKLKGEFDLIYGIPEKGVSLAPAIAMEYFNLTMQDKAWFFTRKFAKTHGEATSAASMVVGRAPKAGERIVLIDDVFTTGETKYEAVSQLSTLAKDANIVGLFIMVDRQEVSDTGVSAVEEFQKKTGIPVYPAMNAVDICKLASDEGLLDFEGRLARYLRTYGTREAVEFARSIVRD